MKKRTLGRASLNDSPARNPKQTLQRWNEDNDRMDPHIGDERQNSVFSSQKIGIYRIYKNVRTKQQNKTYCIDERPTA